MPIDKFSQCFTDSAATTNLATRENKDCLPDPVRNFGEHSNPVLHHPIRILRIIGILSSIFIRGSQM